VVIDPRETQILERLLAEFSGQLIDSDVEREVATSETLEQRADVVWGHRRGIVTCWDCAWEPENAVRAFVFLTLERSAV